MGEYSPLQHVHRTSAARHRSCHAQASWAHAPSIARALRHSGACRLGGPVATLIGISTVLWGALGWAAPAVAPESATGAAASQGLTAVSEDVKAAVR